MGREIEAFPIAVTRLRFPNMLHVGDITKLNGAGLPPVDIICGDSLCQDLSVAGARDGLAGSRSGLFMEQTRITREMRDAEQVRGRTGCLLYTSSGTGFILADLSYVVKLSEGMMRSSKEAHRIQQFCGDASSAAVWNSIAPV